MQCDLPDDGHQITGYDGRIAGEEREVQPAGYAYDNPVVHFGCGAVSVEVEGVLGQEGEQGVALTQRMAQLEAERHAVCQTTEDAVTQKVQQLLRLKGIGINSAWLFVMEFFGWRAFRNRKEVGALRGLTPTPYASGNTAYEQGIAKAGNAHIRAMAIEIAWGWLRFQPQSALTQWYQQRFGHGSSRLRRIGIVALARKLLIALWRFVETGVVPDGAALKAAGRR